MLVCQVPCIWLLLATQGSLENLLRKQETQFTHNFKSNIYSLQVTWQILSPTNHQSDLLAIVLQVLTLGTPFFGGVSVTARGWELDTTDQSTIPASEIIQQPEPNGAVIINLGVNHLPSFTSNLLHSELCVLS